MDSKIFKIINSNARAIIVFGLVTVASVTNAYATSGFVKGNVDVVRTHSAESDPSWAPPFAWFTLKGVSTAGACGKWHGAVLFVVKDKQAMSFVMTALAANLEVAVRFDDALLANGYCLANYVTVGSSAPTH